MSYPERRKKILSLLQNHTDRSVKEISEHLEISPVTIRRDLLKMDTEGLLIRTHGGAMIREELPLIGFKNKIQAEGEIKKEIAKRASREVMEGDILFMDCGSTVFLMCPYLKKIKHLKVITNSLPIVSEFIDTKGIEINLIGGELDKERKAIHGNMAIQHINQYHAYKAFIGIDGISPEFELSSHSEKEYSISHSMIQNSDQVFLLADATKFGKKAYIQWGSMEMVQNWVTNFKPDQQQEISLKGLKTQIIPAGTLDLNPDLG